MLYSLYIIIFFKYYRQFISQIFLGKVRHANPYASTLSMSDKLKCQVILEAFLQRDISRMIPTHNYATARRVGHALQENTLVWGSIMQRRG